MHVGGFGGPTMLNSRTITCSANKNAGNISPITRHPLTAAMFPDMHDARDLYLGGYNDARKWLHRMHANDLFPSQMFKQNPKVLPVL
jgi:hypothetical protein